MAQIIVADATAGALPMLEFALREMWPRQSNRRLDVDAYISVGRVAGAIRGPASVAVTALHDDGVTDEDIDDVLLKLLSHLGSDLPVTRRFCPRAELTPAQARVAERLTTARLVTARSGPVPGYELAHESLITTWPKMTALVEAGHSFLRWRSRMERWLDDAPGQILPAEWLPEARQWCDDRSDQISPRVHALVARSEEEHARRVRELEQARDQARDAAALADALRLAAQAELAARAPTGLTAALALAADSLSLRHTFEGDSATRRLLSLAGRPISSLAHDNAVNAVVFSPDGRWVATASGDGTARGFDPNIGTEDSRLTHDQWVNAVVFSPDGRWVATASGDGTARVYWLYASDLVAELVARMPRPLTDDEWHRFGGRRLVDHQPTTGNESQPS